MQNTLYFIRNLGTHMTLKVFLDLGHFLDQKVSMKFIISSKNIKIRPKKGQNVFKKVKIVWNFLKMFQKNFNEA